MLEELRPHDFVLTKFDVRSSSLLRLVKDERGNYYSLSYDEQLTQISLADVFAVFPNHEGFDLVGMVQVHNTLRLAVYRFNVADSSFADVLEELVKIVDARKSLMPKKLLFFVNPHSGERMHALRIFGRHVSPILKLLSIPFQVVIPTLPSNPLQLDVLKIEAKWMAPPGTVHLSFEYPYDYCFSNNLDDFDGIVSVSGDGTLSDVVLGVLRRKYPADIKPDTELERFDGPTFGIIPAGTTDSVAMTQYGTTDPLTAALSIVSGHRVGFDVQGVFDCPTGFNPKIWETSSPAKAKFLQFSISAVTCGFIPRLTSLSQDIRPVFKGQRFNAAGTMAMMANKPENVAIYYKPSPTQPKHFRTTCGAKCPHCASFANENICNASLTVSSDSWARLGYNHLWSMVSGTGAMLSVYNPHGLSPHCHLGDGTTDLVLQKHQPTLFHYLHFNDKINHMPHNLYDLEEKGLQIVRVVEFSVEPTETADGTKKEPDHPPVNEQNEPKLLCTCDGNLFWCHRLHVVVYCQLVKIFGLGRPLSKSQTH